MAQGVGELTALISILAKTRKFNQVPPSSISRSPNPAVTAVVAVVPELASAVTSFLSTVEGMLTQLTTAVTTLVTSVLKIVPGLLSVLSSRCDRRWILNKLRYSTSILG